MGGMFRRARCLATAPHNHATLVCAGALVLAGAGCGPGGATVGEGTAPPPFAPSPIAIERGDADPWAGVSLPRNRTERLALIDRARAAAAVEPRLLFSRAGDRFVGENATQRFRVEGNGNGLALEAASGSWIATVRLARFGRAGAMQAAGASEPVVTNNTLTIDRGRGVREWYLNLPIGVEQGFTLAERPRGAGPLLLDVAIDGLEPRALPGGGVVLARGPSKVLAYRDVFAADAAGRAVPVDVGVDAGRIRLTVDDRGARYPLTVDPLMASFVQSFMSGTGTTSNNNYGTALAIDADRLIAPDADAFMLGLQNPGVILTYRRTGATWAKTQEIWGSNPNGRLGSPITMAGNSFIAAGAGPGTAVPYDWNGTSWVPAGGLDGYAATPSVALVPSADTVVVGVAGDDTVMQNSGRAFIYKRMPPYNAWTQTQVFTGSAFGQNLGGRVAASAENIFILNPTAGTGARMGVYEWSGSAWVSTATITGPTAETNQVADRVRAAGHTLVWGAPTENGNTGAVYIYQYDGAVWQQTRLVANDTVVPDRFGQRVAIDGSVLAVSAPGKSTVYFFQRDAAGVWQEADRVVGTDVGAVGELGIGLAIFGRNAAITSEMPASPYHGALHVLSLSSDTANGAACNVDADCTTGFCVDHVCCNQRCAAGCESCLAINKASGADGTCGPVKAGLDPHGACVDQTVATCGTTSKCGGAGACAFYAAGLSCAPTCNGGVIVERECNGDGSCVGVRFGADCSAAMQACINGACAACTATAQCATGRYCKQGQCLPMLALGATCAAATDCTSGFCVDGVCCDTACAGNCQTCIGALKASGTSGTCGSVKVGLDPRGSCVAAAPTTCALDGTCDGAGGCRLYPAGTVCGSTCSGDMLLDRACNGSGTCVNGTTGVSCLPQVCKANACAPCAIDADCPAGRYCAAGACVEKGGLGAACVRPEDCAVPFCVEGVCCDSGCGGTCQSCRAAAKGSGTDGVCGFAMAGTDPRASCADQGPLSCGLDGACDGVGACRYYRQGVACGVASCSGTRAVGDLCNGTGQCAANPGGVECSPFVCRGSGCVTRCTADADCVTGKVCVAGACVDRPANGSACTSGAGCASGFCVEGVCCNAACAGTCESCRAAAKASGPDGTCGPIKAGDDPKNACADQGAASCGTDGACDGAGACGRYASGTSCGASTCANGAVTGRICNGSGQCTDAPGGMPCAPFACRNGGCLNVCAGDADCVGGTVCINSNCTNIGATCVSGAECLSGFCVDGLCCDRACTGACESCRGNENVSGVSGSCGPVKNGTDPAAECATGDPAACGLDGQCDGAGACRRYASGTSCGTSTCAGTTVTGAICNGSGQCVTATSGVECAPYACRAGACARPCTADTDCVTGTICAAGACVTPGPLGSSCAAGRECASGFCADGRCCNRACGGLCETCLGGQQVAGTDGTCGPVQAGLDPGNDCTAGTPESCGRDGTCDGAGACRLFSRGTSCGATVCQSELVVGMVCDGAGVCGASAGASCGDYRCVGSGCANPCRSNSDCVAGRICAQALCVPPGGAGDRCTADDQCASGRCASGILRGARRRRRRHRRRERDGRGGRARGG